MLFCVKLLRNESAGLVYTAMCFEYGIYTEIRCYLADLETITFTLTYRTYKHM